MKREMTHEVSARVYTAAPVYSSDGLYRDDS